MNYTIVFSGILFLLFTTSLASEIEDAAKAKAKGSKQLSLFSIVTFQNLDCKSASDSRNGTCFTSTECSDKGGRESGNCAAGFGVCCLFIYTDTGSAVNQNCSYIQSPNFPSTFTASTASSLTYTIHKCSNDVCAVRLDFETFSTVRDTVDPALESNTCADPFTITSTSQGTSGEICGENAGQHIYWDLGRDSTATATISMTFSTVAAVTGTGRSSEIKVTQISCNDENAPDSGCFQYHDGLTGRITTFNWDATSTSNQLHLANQQYNICIRPAEGMCCVQYTPCDFDASFTTTAMGALASWSLDSSGTGAITVDTGSLCLDDYINIDGAGSMCQQGKNAVTSGRLCGVVFGGGIAKTIANFGESTACDCTAPFTVGVVTDAIDEADNSAPAVGARGICLEYTQIPCV